MDKLIGLQHFGRATVSETIKRFVAEAEFCWQFVGGPFHWWMQNGTAINNYPWMRRN